MLDQVFFGTCFWLFLLAQCGAQAQEFHLGDPKRDAEPTEVLINVRTVKADRSTSAIPATGDAASTPVLIDSRLADLSARLKKLPFQSFKLLSAEHRLVPIKKREAITLGGGNVLTVRPLYIENDKVGVWLKWQDKNGADILDTRLHLDCDESMLAGTDATDQTGLILAIDVKKE